LLVPLTELSGLVLSVASFHHFHLNHFANGQVMFEV
jgi:hypothetical protein